MAVALLDSDCSFRLRFLFKFEDLGLLMLSKLLDALRPLELLQRESAHDRPLHLAYLRFIRNDKNEVVS
jgi:hypothetical protein